MARTKGKAKVNQQSLEVLKKSVKAGGRKSNAAAKVEKKPATPVRSASRSRSRSRSRTPGRAQKAGAGAVTEIKKAETKKVETKTPAKRTPAVKKKAEPKLKRLDDEKKTTKGRKRAAPKGKGKGAAEGKAVAGTGRAGRPKKPVESHIAKDEPMETNSIPTSTSSSSVNSRGPKGRKSTSPVGSEPINGSSGWFSKCIIS